MIAYFTTPMYPFSEVDESVKTRPSVIGPYNSPPTIYNIPQKTPTTMYPAVTTGKPTASSTSTTMTSTITRQPSTNSQPLLSTGWQPGTTHTSVTSAGVLPTAQGQTGVSWRWLG